MDPRLGEVIHFLNGHRIRATYGAVAELLGVLPISMGARIGPHTREASWIVSGETGFPTGYAPDEIHPDVLPSTPLIRSGTDLASEMAQVADSTSRQLLPEMPPLPPSAFDAPTKLNPAYLVAGPAVAGLWSLGAGGGDLATLLGAWTGTLIPPAVVAFVVAGRKADWAGFSRWFFWLALLIAPVLRTIAAIAAASRQVR